MLLTPRRDGGGENICTEKTTIRWNTYCKIVSTHQPIMLHHFWEVIIQSAYFEPSVSHVTWRSFEGFILDAFVSVSAVKLASHLQKLYLMHFDACVNVCNSLWLWAYINIYKYIFTYSDCFCIKRFVFLSYLWEIKPKKQAGPRLNIYCKYCFKNVKSILGQSPPQTVKC